MQLLLINGFLCHLSKDDFIISAVLKNAKNVLPDKDIFDFNNNFIPLSSSFNAANGQVGQGRTTNAEKGELLSDSGEQTKDSDANLNR